MFTKPSNNFFICFVFTFNHLCVCAFKQRIVTNTRLKCQAPCSLSKFQKNSIVSELLTLKIKIACECEEMGNSVATL